MLGKITIISILQQECVDIFTSAERSSSWGHAIMRRPASVRQSVSPSVRGQGTFQHGKRYRANSWCQGTLGKSWLTFFSFSGLCGPKFSYGPKFTFYMYSYGECLGVVCTDYYTYNQMSDHVYNPYQDLSWHTIHLTLHAFSRSQWT